MINIKPNLPQPRLYELILCSFFILLANVNLQAAIHSSPTQESDLEKKNSIIDHDSHYIEKQNRLNLEHFNPTPRPCSGELINPELSWIDRIHLSLSQRVCDAAIQFDHFFGNVRYSDDYASSFIRIRNSFVVERGQDTDISFEPRIKARIHLPNAKEHFNLIISDDYDNDNTLSTSSDSLSSDLTDSNRYSTTLRWIAEKQNEELIDFDIGARFDNGIELFLRSRYRNFYRLDETRGFRVLSAFQWRDTESISQRMEINYEQKINNALFLRLENIEEFGEVTEGVEWIHRTSLWHQIHYRTAVSYAFAISGHTRPTYLTDEYGFSIRVRNQLYSHWFFIEAEPQIVWVQNPDSLEEDRDKVLRLIIRFEIQLGHQ